MDSLSMLENVALIFMTIFYGTLSLCMIVWIIGVVIQFIQDIKWDIENK